jgi:tetratricopeptide (TPR) repeat protein
LLLLAVCGELIFFFVRTRQQLPVWHDSETLWSAAADYFPESGVAQGHLASVLAGQRRFDEALPHAQAAYADMPEYPVARDTFEAVCSGLAYVRVERRQFSEALPCAREAVELDPTNSSYRAMLGLIYLKTRQFAEAVPELRAALRLNPDLSAARYNLACAYSRTGRFAEACETLQVLLVSQPQFAQMAARDAEMKELRADPVYGERFRTLVDGGRTP